MTVASLTDFPDFTREMLVELGGSVELRAARKLFQGDAVRDLSWQNPVVDGVVVDGDTRHQTSLNLRSLVFVECRCSCETGRRGTVCRHALALCLQAEAEQGRDVENGSSSESEPAAPEPETPLAAEKELRTIRDDPDGTALALWILLPPNLEKAATQGSISLKLELETPAWRGPPEQLPTDQPYAVTQALRGVLAELEAMGEGRVNGLIRLPPAILAVMLQALGDEARLAWINAPAVKIPSEFGIFPGVSSHLFSSPPTAATPPPARPAPRPKPTLARRAEAPAALKVELDGSEHFLSFRFSNRSHPRALHWIEILKEHSFKVEPSNEKYWLRDRHHTLNFLASHWEALKADNKVSFTRNFKQRTRQLALVQCRLQSTDSPDGLDLSLTVDAGEATPGELQRALLSNQFYLKSGKKLFLLQPELLERVVRFQQQLTGSREQVLATRFKTRLNKAMLPVAADLLEEADLDDQLAEDWGARSAALRRIDSLQPAPVNADFSNRLRPYQRIGAAWLWHLLNNELGGILADEMGLGKTLQALALIEAALSSRQGETVAPPPALVVCPASLVENWRREAARFTPELAVFGHHGSNRLSGPDEARTYQLIITSYGTLVRDQVLFEDTPWVVVIADEAQHVKNRRTQAARALRSLHSNGRFVLTGTPIENAADDLRGLFSFLMPGYLRALPPGMKGEDRAWYDQYHLQQAAPYILRRTKKIVAPELPEKIEQTLFCEMPPEQRQFYETIRRRTEARIVEMENAGAGENQIKFAALTQLLRLRQVCADPRVLDPEFKSKNSAKWRALREILDEASDDGHRVLLFSQFTGVLKLLRESLQAEGTPLCYLDGATSNRQQICDRFNEDPSIPIFLISLKAGGVGLNLTGADTVIHYDPWWNPAAEAQATDRAHRIGQERVVTSIKFIAANTVEEKVLEIQATKARLLRDLFEASDAASAKVSLADIKSLIAAAH